MEHQDLQDEIMKKENEIVIFETEDKQIKLFVNVENETVWLSANQMAVLFGRDGKTIRKHINHAFSENEVEKITTRKKCVLME